MAGIGFELRKLLRKDDLFGILQGYGHSALTATGPWLLTIVTLSGLVFFGSENLTPDELSEFRLIIIYNFAFSLVGAGPTTMVATRYLADAIYMKKVEEAPSMMLSYVILLFAPQALIVVPFYLFMVDIELPLAILAIINFFIVSAIWLISAFLTALKDYGSITRSFVLGTILALGSSALLASTASTAAMMLGFNIGFGVILFSLIARVFVEYPYPVTSPFRYGKYFRIYWELALSGLVYNTAIWADKWVMWFAPEREVLQSGLISYPDYDSAMFLAYLTIVPSIAAFVLTVETDFFESYLQFYRNIQNHKNYAEIERAHKEIIDSSLRGSRTFIVLQGSVCLATILMAPQIFTLFNINFAQIGIFRIGVLGAFFHVLFLALSIVLSYFNLRRTTLKIQLLFLVTNTVFSYASMRMGFPYYGFGYFLAALVTFTATFLATAHYLGRLPYQTFVVSNASVER
jgi:uncharacterized membrane protein